MKPTGTAIRTTQYAACTAMAAVLLAGCASTNPMARATSNYSATSPSVKETNRAVAKAESAVEKSPVDAAARGALARSYLQSGRFESAVTTLEDAIQLGDNDARTWLSLSLAHIGAGNTAEARAILDQHRDIIPVGDLGLAIALSGDSGRGVAILSDAIRSGENTPKMRQNLAYAYALDGSWREARLMAAQDVPAGQLDHRLGSWASQSRPEDSRKRVASLLGAPVRADSGQPQHLALNAGTNTGVAPASTDVASANTAPYETAAFVPQSRQGELPPAEEGENFWIAEAVRPEPRPASPVVQAPVAQTGPFLAAPVRDNPTVSSFDNVFGARQTVPQSQPVAQSGPQSQSVAQPVAKSNPTPAFVSRPVVQSVPVSVPAWNNTPQPAPQVRRDPAPVRSSPTNSSHLVQLGSFSNPQNAERAWGIFVAENPELRNHEKVITQAIVNGRKYWRVSAAGFDKGTSKSMCYSVKGRGGGCIAWASNRPLPGALNSKGTGGVMRARR